MFKLAGRPRQGNRSTGAKLVRLKSIDNCLKCGESSGDKEWASFCHVTDKKGNRTGQKVPYGGACDERDTTHVQSPPDIQGSLAQVADAIESDPKSHTAQLWNEAESRSKAIDPPSFLPSRVDTGEETSLEISEVWKGMTPDLFFTIMANRTSNLERNCRVALRLVVPHRSRALSSRTHMTSCLV